MDSQKPHPLFILSDETTSTDSIYYLVNHFHCLGLLHIVKPQPNENKTWRTDGQMDRQKWWNHSHCLYLLSGETTSTVSCLNISGETTSTVSVYHIVKPQHREHIREWAFFNIWFFVQHAIIVHVHADFRENTAMRLRVRVKTKRDWHTIRIDWRGVSISPVPGLGHGWR